MEKNERVRKNNKGDKDQKRHIAQQSPEPLVDESLAWGADQSLLTETPFYSRIGEHAETLSRIPFAVQRQEYIMRLNNAYGLRYVQHLLKSVNAQAKLTVSSPGDIYEQEADRVAEDVTRSINAPVQRQTPDEEEELQMMQDLERQADEEEEEVQLMPDLQRQDEEEDEELVQMMPDVQRQDEEEDEELVQMMPDLQRQDEEEDEELVQMAPDLQRQDEEEDEELVQTMPDEKSETVVANEIEARINSAKGGGRPLSNEVKKPMEQAFGVGFNSVKIHTDTEADTLNKQLNAKAFTTGQDIFFRDGEYRPGSDGGNKLIAHELTHIIQQGSSSRIARWGGGGNTQHKEVTDATFGNGNFQTKYDQGSMDYISSFTDSMDYRARMWGDYVINTIKNIPEKQNLKKKAKAYDNLEGYDLDKDEATNHAEAGLYKSGNGAGENDVRVHEWLDKAVAAWQGGNKNQALSTLGLALHTAEDRGAHGEGAPGKGHDPRLRIQPPPSAEKNYYKAGWQNSDCDKKEINGAGYQQAIQYAGDVLTEFHDRVKPEDEQNFIITKGVGGKEGKEELVRKIAIWFGVQPEELSVSKIVEMLGTCSLELLKFLASLSLGVLKLVGHLSLEALKFILSCPFSILKWLLNKSIEGLEKLFKCSLEKLKYLLTRPLEILQALFDLTIEGLKWLLDASVELLQFILNLSIGLVKALFKLSIKVLSWLVKGGIWLVKWVVKKLTSKQEEQVENRAAAEA